MTIWITSLLLLMIADPGSDLKAGPLENIAKGAVSGALSFILDTPASVDGVRLDLKAQVLELTDLRIANPKGFDAAQIITAKTVRIEADPKSLFSQDPVVRLARVDGVTVNAEANLAHGVNLKKLLDNAGRFKGPKLFKGPPKKLWRIEKAVLDNASLNIAAPGLGGTPTQKTIDHFETSLGGGGGNGLQSNEVMTKVLGLIIEKAGLAQDLPFR